MMTLANWLKKSDQNRKLFAEEGLILEATETIWGALNKCGWNKSQLAKKLGTSKANVTQLLNGSRNLTLRTLADIAFALGLEAHVSFCDARDAALWRNTGAIVVTLPHVLSEPIEEAANDGWTKPSMPQRIATEHASACR